MVELVRISLQKNCGQMYISVWSWTNKKYIKTNKMWWIIALCFCADQMLNKLKTSGFTIPYPVCFLPLPWWQENLSKEQIEKGRERGIKDIDILRRKGRGGKDNNGKRKGEKRERVRRRRERVSLSAISFCPPNCPWVSVMPGGRAEGGARGAELRECVGCARASGQQIAVAAVNGTHAHWLSLPAQYSTDA